MCHYTDLDLFDTHGIFDEQVGGIDNRCSFMRVVSLCRRDTGKTFTRYI